MIQERKIIFFDIDGTIYRRECGIPQSTKEAFVLLRKNGHIPVLCTGRPFSTVLPELLDLGCSGLIAGAGTYIQYEGKVLRNALMSREQIKKALEILEMAGTEVLLEGPRYLYYNKTGDGAECFHEVKRIQKVFPERLKDLTVDAEACKMTLHIKDAERFDKWKSELEKDFNIIRYERIPVAELVPGKMSKAKGIEYLLSYLHMSREDSFAFGDGPNDLEMLQYVKYGIAMGDSEDQVLRAVKYRTDRMEENGVWNALKDFGLI